MKTVNTNDIDYAKGFCKDADGLYLEETENDLIFFKDGYFQSIDDKPAIIYKTGSKFWYDKGELHRETGPSIMYNTGVNLYYIRGKEFSEEDFVNLMLEKNLKQAHNGKKLKI